MNHHTAGYWAALLHRLSGIALVLFLPLHFLALGLALESAEALDRMLVFAELPLVKAAEWGLVLLLTLHLGLGLRLLAIELLAWRGLRTPWIGWSAAAAVVVSMVFLLRVI